MAGEFEEALAVGAPAGPTGEEEPIRGFCWETGFHLADCQKLKPLGHPLFLQVRDISSREASFADVS